MKSVMLGAGEGESGGAKEKVAFPLGLKKRVVFILVSKRVGRIEGRVWIFLVLIENFSFLAHLFYFMMLYCIIKYGNETHPEE